VLPLDKLRAGPALTCQFNVLSRNPVAHARGSLPWRSALALPDIGFENIGQGADATARHEAAGSNQEVERSGGIAAIQLRDNRRAM
jgi:hypothetical protein